MSAANSNGSAAARTQVILSAQRQRLAPPAGCVMPEPIGLSPGQSVELTIDRLAFGGEGVGRCDGVSVFVADVCPGERVAATITEVHPRFARGRLDQVLTPAPERVPPLCPVVGQCGGCQLQHLDYPAQLAAKEGFVRDALTRLGKLPDVPVAPIVASPVPYGYRNKVELVVDADEQGAPVLAYHGREPGQRVPIVECLLALPEVNAVLDAVAAWLPATGWPPYDEFSGKGLVREVGVRWSRGTREANLLLVTGRRDVPDKRPWLDSLRAELPALVGVRHRARTRASQSADGRPVQEMLGRPLRCKAPGELSLRVAPEAFYQVNDLLLEALVEHLAQVLELQPDDHLADLYGGVGTFGLCLARRVGRVTILELEAEAARDAEANAAFNKLDNVRVERGQVEQRLAHLAREQRPTKLVLDPPRRGLSDGGVRLVASVGARRLAYVSCDPATLARDLARFAAGGWRTAQVQPFDLFPQTYHVECIATLVPA